MTFCQNRCSTRLITLFSLIFKPKSSRSAWLAGLTLMLLPCLSSSADNQVYRWVDESGITHYGEAPPKEETTAVELIRTRKDYSSDAASARTAYEKKQKADSETQAKTDDSKHSTADADALIAERNKKIEESCKTAQQNLNVLTSHGRVREKSTNGEEQRYLSEEEHQNRIRETTEYLNENCQNR
ncbi:MAG: DUF4124 domain-containing protein [Gammaproteobacteria bacterium]